MSSAVTYTSPEMLPKIAEWHVYGNEQQGRFLTKFPEVEPTYYGVDVSLDVQNNIFSRQLGKKAYELKDHLGNVRVTHSDIKMPTGTPAQPFRVDLLSKSEYYPYGMKINYLSFNATGARYGYNGTHEQDKELNGDGNYLDFGNFGYDTRVAMRRNQEPLSANYANLSGYSAFGSNPIMYSDLDGDITGVIPGTAQTLGTDAGFTKSTTAIAQGYSTKVDKEKETILNLSWNNNTGNAILQSNREAEGKRLAQEFFKTYKESYSGEDITLIGYSYGGDVAMYMAKELNLLTNGEVKIQIVSLSTPLDIDLVNSIKDKSNIKIDHFFVDNDVTVNIAGKGDAFNNRSNRYLFGGNDPSRCNTCGNFNQYYLSNDLLSSFSKRDFNKLEYYGKTTWAQLFGFDKKHNGDPYKFLGLEGGNHGWPYYPDLVQGALNFYKKF